MIRFFLQLFFCCFSILLFGQFPPAADQSGTSAIPKDADIFVNWAKEAIIERGQQNIADDSLNFAEVGEPIFALGPPDNQTVSLGDSGVAILTFEKPIQDGEGFDFAVFENGFPTQGGYFLELAFVEVSSDGDFFVRFPATSLTNTINQLATFDLVNPTQINNLAGKYISGYGTPFDLAELANITGLDISNITHVKIIDVIGSLADNVATFDSYGNKINDPFPTPFPSGGFDLDAIGVIHQRLNTASKAIPLAEQIQIFPNPLAMGDFLNITFINPPFSKFNLELYSTTGSLLKTFSINQYPLSISFKDRAKGVYYLKINDNEQSIVKKIMVLD